MVNLFRQIITVIAGLMMTIGAFVPIIGVPIFKDDSYFDLSPSGAMIIISLAGLSVLVALTKRFWGLYITGILALALVIYTFFSIQERKSTIQADIRDHVANNPLKSLSAKIVGATSLRYGFNLMFLGSGILVAIPLVSSRIARVKKKSRSESENSA
jgi:hypothetical protein